MNKEDIIKSGYVVEEPGDDSSPEEKEAFTRLNDIFKDLPENHYGVYNNSTKELIDLGGLDGAIGSVLFEADQVSDLDRGVGHNVKFHMMT